MKPFKRGDLNAGSGKDMRRINIGCGAPTAVNLGASTGDPRAGLRRRRDSDPQEIVTRAAAHIGVALHRDRAPLRRSAESEPPLLDDEATIFDVEQPGALGNGATLLRSDAELKPQRRRPGLHGLSGHRRRRRRWSKDVDQTNWFGNLVQRPIGGFAQNLVGVWIHRDYAPAVLLHMRRDGVCCLCWVRAGPDDGDCVVCPENVLHQGIGVVHRHPPRDLTVPRARRTSTLERRPCHSGA
jgi:hypothetical protein